MFLWCPCILRTFPHHVNGTLSRFSTLRTMQVLSDTAHVKTLLTQTRKSRGLSLDQAAASVGTDPTNLSRVEKGMQIPKRELARALYVFYQGVVPLGAIYDPEWNTDEALTQGKRRKRKEA